MRPGLFIMICLSISALLLVGSLWVMGMTRS